GTPRWPWLSPRLLPAASRWAAIRIMTPTHPFVQDLRARQVMPHVAQHTTNRASAIDGRTTRHPGYAVRQQKRTRVEEIFGWLKTVGLLRKVKLRGVQRVGWLFTFAAAVYNLVRMRNLVKATT
ncbi:MAG: transposase, partial [Nitrospira sp.]|nr:transposase [Nitrospira sp.]